MELCNMHFQNSPLIANKQASIKIKEALSLLGKELAKFELLGLEYSIYPRLLRSTQALKAATNQYQSDAYFHDIEQVAKALISLTV